MHYDSLLKSHCAFANSDERKFKTLLWQFIESVEGPQQGYQHCLEDVYQPRLNYVCNAGYNIRAIKKGNSESN